MNTADIVRIIVGGIAVVSALGFAASKLWEKFKPAAQPTLTPTPTAELYRALGLNPPVVATVEPPKVTEAANIESEVELFRAFQLLRNHFVKRNDITRLKQFEQLFSYAFMPSSDGSAITITTATTDAPKT